MFKSMRLALLLVLLGSLAVGCSVNQLFNVPPDDLHPIPPPLDIGSTPPEKWGASADKFAIAIHRIAMIDRQISLLYSVALAPSVLGAGGAFSVTLLPSTRLISKGGNMALVRSVPFRSTGDVNVGVAVFGAYPGGGDTISLQVRDLEVKKPGAAPVTVSDNVEIPLLIDYRPNDPIWGRSYDFGSVPERQVGHVVIKSFGGGFAGPSPKGDVATFGVQVGNAGGVYALVKEGGEVQELTASQFNNPRAYLGLPALPARTRGPAPVYPTGPGPTRPPTGVARTPTPPPPLLPKLP